MRVELSRISSAPNKKAMNKVIDDMLANAEEDESPLFISDLLAEHEIAGPILAALRTNPDKVYKLYMVRGEWGEPPVPGFVVKRKHKKSLTDREGYLYPSTVLNGWKKKGIYDKMRYHFEEYKLDEKGCITVDAANAEYFLSQWGIHSDSGYPLSYHPQENSTEEVNYPGGGKRHVWYYRWKEMEKEMYDALPILKVDESQSGKNRNHK